MALSIGFLIYTVVQFVAFVCVLTATPIDMFGFRNGSTLTRFPNQCITLWGVKTECKSLMYESLSERQWRRCPARRNRFRAAQAFAVISIFVYGAAFVLGAIMLFCCRWLRWVCLTLNSVGAVTVCIVLVSMVVTYNMDEGTSCFALKIFYIFSTGFFLLVVACALDVLNIAMLLFLWLDCCSREEEKTMDSEGRESKEENKEETQA
ncbi:putative Amastin surface glycoprotein [Leishmania naiffi]|uniref:Amastin surface glycoprotein n=1 Tax=Leishmania naiffi TaxID=5678 RepID=A0AAW3CBW9_9TRYP